MAFKGSVIDFPLGPLGLTGNENTSATDPRYLLEATNVSFDGGTIRKEGGAVAYSTSALAGLPPILAGVDWRPTSTTRRQVIYDGNGNQWMDGDDGTFATSIGAALSTSCNPVWVPAGEEAPGNNRKLFLFNGVNIPYVLNGTASSLSTFSAPAADWSSGNPPICGCVHDSRLWVIGGHRLYYSQTTNHENFTGSGSGTISVFPGEGHYGIQVVSFKGLLVVFKYPYGIYAVNTTAVDPTDWTVSRISRSIGGASPHAAVPIEDDVLFLSANGQLQLLSGIQEFGSLGSRDVGYLHRLDPFVNANVRIGHLTKAQGVYYPTRREVHYAVPRSGSSVNNARLVVDFNLSGTPRFRWSPRDACPSIWTRRDGDNDLKLMIGDDVGKVWMLDYTTRTKGGSGYTGSFQTAHNDLGAPGVRKEGRWLEVMMEPDGTWTVSCDVIWDDATHATISLNPTIGGTGLGGFILGTHALGGTVVATIRKRLPGGGRRLSLKFYNSADGSDFNISRALVGFQTGSDFLPR